ncbi:MBL fold metallo-hydrolase [Sulfuriflexus mobilis]|uniref:MBL fold metallo-hydrolase n=1 Tax=Sulfuriflexus mobilis TaxID=1811807 RepID=UPI000F83D508|nr:MBL fold metallo-hydrolase [Sulfuriflexus mobilis]
MLFRQLYEPDSSTYSYLLSCPESGETVIIDPVLDTAERDMSVLQSLGLKLTYTIDTHIHADHLSGARRLKALAGSSICYPAVDELACADIGLQEGKPFKVGNIDIHPLFTPGHTDHHHGYLIHTPVQSMLFSGDALLIDGVGRTDFQSGDSEALYNSIQQKYFSLPDDTLVYPCHDYNQRRVSSIAQEKARNAHIGGAKSLEEFKTIMANLDLPYPRKIDFAVPGNEQCGQCPDNVPSEFRGPCARHDQG